MKTSDNNITSTGYACGNLIDYTIPLLIVLALTLGSIAGWHYYNEAHPKPLVFTQALRFENFFIVPVDATHYALLTNRYPSNLVAYPLIFK